MTTRHAILALLAALAAPFVAPPTHAATGEDALKLAFTYNIARFVTWPARDTGEASAFRLCVMGRDAYRIASENLGSRRVGALPISVVAVERPADAAGHCDLLYLAGLVDGGADAFVGEVDADPVLTVSDTPGFAELGGIVELTRRSDRVAMRINVAASRRAGLTISSQLLSLATLVANEAEGEG